MGNDLMEMETSLDEFEIDPAALLTRQYEVLNHSGNGYTEIRVPKKGVQLFVQSKEEFVAEALKLCKEDTYVGINPRKTKSGREEDVSAVTTIVFDFDPIRPKDTGSSNEQLSEALALGRRLAADEEGLLVSSGSGAHVYVPVNTIPITEENRHSVRESLREYAQGIQKKYSTSRIKVDSTFDLPRIIRCWGSFNTKSKRYCDLISGEIERRSFNVKDHKLPSLAQVVPQAPSGSEELGIRFEKAVKNSPLLQKMLAKKATFFSRSEADFAFGRELIRAGFGPQEVASLLGRNPLGKSSQRSQRELLAEAGRISAKCVSEQPKQLESSLATGWGSSYLADLDQRKPGICTGFERWDQMTAGLKGGRFYIVAGRPTDGKTTYLVQQALGVARKGHKVLYFPTECSTNSIRDKMVSSIARVNLRTFQFGNFTPEQRKAVDDATREAEKLDIVIAENFSLKLEYIERMVRSEKPAYVIVDFLQGMSYNDVNSSSELGQVVMGVKLLGKDLDIPITLASQLHRKPKDVPDSLSDLKGTGKLEEEGDVVTFIRTLDAEPFPAKSAATIFKNKYGEPGIIPMDFYRDTCRFEEA